MSGTERHGLLFDRVAEEYDRVRRGYPASLVDAACSVAGLGPGSRVVEVGCGTGKLTLALVERGLHVDAVDPGPALVAVARSRVADAPVRFHVAPFEEVDLPAGAFAAVFSATAFHWVDPRVGWSKAARLLEPGGVLALLTHVGGWLLELEPEFLAAWREVLPEAAAWVRRDPETLWRGAEQRRSNVSELWAWLTKRDIGRPEAAGLFGDVRIESVPIELEETAEELVALLRTTSAYLRLDAERRSLLERRLTALVERAGGVYRSTLFATLVTARLAALGEVTMPLDLKDVSKVQRWVSPLSRLLQGRGVTTWRPRATRRGRVWRTRSRSRRAPPTAGRASPPRRLPGPLLVAP